MTWTRCPHCGAHFDWDLSPACLDCGYHGLPAGPPKASKELSGKEAPRTPPQVEIEAKRDGGWAQWLIVAALIFLLFAPAPFIAIAAILIRTIGFGCAVVMALLYVPRARQGPKRESLPEVSRGIPQEVSPSVWKKVTLVGVVKFLALFLATIALLGAAGLVLVYVICLYLPPP